jgi:hypothetical protein
MIDEGKLKMYYHNIDINDVFISFDTINKDKVLEELCESKYCPINSLKYLRKANKFIKLQSNKYEISYNIFYNNKCKICITKFLISFKRAIATKQYFNINKSFNIFIILAPQKRFIPKNKLIDVIHINGGFTNTNANYIYIVREEEFAKVILHEILHHGDIIHSENWNNDQLLKLKNSFNIDKSTFLYPNEAVVELWATIIHCYLLSIEYNIPYSILLNREVQHSKRLCLQLLQKQGRNKWKEYTNSYCYVVFKTILLCNITKLFINYTFPYSTEYITTFLIENKFRLVSNSKINKSLRLLITSDF